MSVPLPRAAVRRLLVKYAQAEGANLVAEQARATATQFADQYLEALRAACEDADVALPGPNVRANVSIDWETGEVRIDVQDEAPNGQVPTEEVSSG